MFTAKLKELAVNGKLTLYIRVALIALTLASSLIFGGEVLAGPTPGQVGG